MEFLTIKNELGMKVTVCDVGAGLYDIVVPDRNGNLESVLVKPYNKKQYCYATSYFGKPCGRTAGRISGGVFQLDGKEYQIKKDESEENALHGGIDGISYKTFNYEMRNTPEAIEVIYSYLSKDMESGYPGNLNIIITYSLAKKENQLAITFNCETDKTTLCNLTNHAYFNLSGNVRRNILNHELFINSSNYGYINSHSIPEKIIPVTKEFDFQKPHPIGDFILEKSVVENTNGYDHPFILNEENPEIVQVSLYDPESGRKLEISSTYEAVVAYSCNYPEKVILSNGNQLKKNDAICLELQHFPNTINSYFLKNKKDILSPNKQYLQRILFNFKIN